VANGRYLSPTIEISAYLGKVTTNIDARFLYPLIGD